MLIKIIHTLSCASGFITGANLWVIRLLFWPVEGRNVFTGVLITVYCLLPTTIVLLSVVLAIVETGFIPGTFCLNVTYVGPICPVPLEVDGKVVIFPLDTISLGTLDADPFDRALEKDS